MLTDFQKSRVKLTKDLFKKDFGKEPTDYFQSCGRLEIIGNHMDYNGGKVINSSAGNLNIFASTSKADKIITVKSEGYPDLVVDTTDLAFRKEEEDTSYALVRGICKRFTDLGYKIGGFNLEMNSTIYKGGGVSSSAAYCCLICKVLSYYYNNDSIPMVEMAKASRWTENNYFGKGSGLQDEIGCMAKGFTITDYKNQEDPVIESFLVNLGDYRIYLIDTKTDHSGSQDGFNGLVRDMKSISEKFGVKYLIDIPVAKFKEAFKDHKDDRAWKRAEHFFEELDRTDRACAALKKGDIKAFMKEFNDSGMSSEYNLQSIVDAGEKTNNLYVCLHKGRELLKDGAIRVHGGGFGGTAMVWVNKNEADAFIKGMAPEFAPDQFIPVFPSNDPLRRIPDEEL